MKLDLVMVELGLVVLDAVVESLMLKLMVNLDLQSLQMCSGESLAPDFQVIERVDESSYPFSPFSLQFFDHDLLDC